MHLTDLKRPGTPLSDVEPLFTGMPLREWLLAVERSRTQEFLTSPKWQKIHALQKWDKGKIESAKKVLASSSEMV